MARRIKKFDSEDNLHQQVADYLRLQYPLIMFRTDFAAGIKMTQGQAMKHKRLQSGRAWPDLFIAAPAFKDDRTDFYGLFIELKKPDTKLKRDKDAAKILKGETKLRVKGDWFDQHIEEQADVISHLRANGYYATFAVGFDEARKVIDTYLDGYKVADELNNEEVF